MKTILILSPHSEDYMARVTKDRHGELLYCGRTWVIDTLCPWRSCFNPHDCGRISRRGKWVRDGYCLTNYKWGCPTSKHFLVCCDEPEFSTRGRAMKRTCRNCGQKVPVEVIEALRESDS